MNEAISSEPKTAEKANVESVQEAFTRQLRPNSGSITRKRIRGRGVSSGRGRTSGRGHKGQNARPGSSDKPGFEGGQNPLIRRLPKVGFSNMPHKKKITVVTLTRLAQVYDDGAEITEEMMRASGVLKGSCDGIKVVNGKKVGQVEKKFTFTGNILYSSSVQKACGLTPVAKTAKKASSSMRNSKTIAKDAKTKE